MESSLKIEFYNGFKTLKSKEVTKVYSDILLNGRPYFRNPKQWWTKHQNLFTSSADFRLKILVCHTFLDVEFNDQLRLFSSHLPDIPRKTLKDMKLMSKVKLLCLRGFFDVEDAVEIYILNKLRNQIAHELVDDILLLDFSRFHHYADTGIEERFKLNKVKRQAKELFLSVKLLHIAGFRPEFGKKRNK